MQIVNLTHHFLIAMPNMADPHFSRSLTYICEHTDQGALGVVVNKPINLTLAQLFQQVEIPFDDPTSSAQARQPVYFGGPVQTDHGFVLHQPAGTWNASLAINSDIALTASKDVLEAMARGAGPERAMVTLGYAGWGAGQLEDEIQRNGWLTVRADPNVIFDSPPADRMTAAMGMLGLNFANFSDSAGHA